jgi:hypothetical protein
MLFFMLADIAVAGAPITAEKFLQKAGLGVDLQSLLAGEIITLGRSEHEINTELNVAMLVFIPAFLPETVAALQQQSMTVSNPSIIAVEEIKDGPNAAGEESTFKNVKFDESDSREVNLLMKIGPGSDDNLSREEIALFQRAADRVHAGKGDYASAAEAMSRIMRKVLNNRYTSYRLWGLKSLTPYQRSESLQVSPAEELIIATESMIILQEHFPLFYLCLRYFPDKNAGKFVHQFFWVKQQQDKRTLFVLKHWLADIDSDYALIVERQYYLSNTLNSLQVGILCLPYRSGSLVALLNQAFTEKVDVRIGKKIAKRIGRQQVDKQIRPLFENLRATFAQ